MATLVPQAISRSGLKPTYAAANGGGDEFVNNGEQFIHIKNGSVASKTVTIGTPNTVDGLAIADRTKTILAGEEAMIGPLPANIYNDANGKVQLTYDAVTTVTIAIIDFGG